MMQFRSKSTCRSIFYGALLLATVGSRSSQAADAPRQPATVGEAAKVLDLGTLPLVSGAKPPQRHLVAGLGYIAPGDVKTAFEFHRKQFAEGQWTELPGSNVTDQYATALFSKAEFIVSLMVLPGSEVGTANVNLTNLGNVDLAKMPVPPEAKPFYAGPNSAMFVTAVPVEPTQQACRTLFMAKGWEPYGVAGDSLFFKQNAIRLTASIGAAPAQGGKTMITYSSELMSAELPAPLEAENLQYSDSTTQLLFDTRLSMKAVEAFYRTTLAKTGWEATTEHPFKMDFKEHLIFREPQKNLLELEMYEVEGKNRIVLEYQTAAEVAELDRLVKAEAARRKAELNKPKPLNPKLVVALPPEAKEIELTKSEIKFQVASGKARAVVEAWRKQFTQDGWKEDVSVLEDVAGGLSYSKDRQSLTLSYTDTGVLPTEITLDAIGVDLERAAEKK